MIKRILLKLGKLIKRIRTARPVALWYGGIFFLFNRLMFLFPVLTKRNNANYGKKDKNPHQQKDNSSFIHFYSPLSRIVAQIKQPMKKIIPTRNIIKRNLLSDTNCPKTTTASINLPTSKIFLLKFSLCFCVNLIFKNILSKVKISVKQAVIWRI